LLFHLERWNVTDLSYKITGREVDPVADLLKAVIAVNWHKADAQQQGWAVTLEVVAEDLGGQLAVTVARVDNWPTAESEAGAAE
jgi:hypothetical protein